MDSRFRRLGHVAFYHTVAARHILTLSYEILLSSVEVPPVQRRFEGRGIIELTPQPQIRTCVLKPLNHLLVMRLAPTTHELLGVVVA